MAHQIVMKCYCFFFEKAVGLERHDKSAVLEWGDTVIMDNRGFHHRHFVQPLLNMLNKCGVRLLFHPAYSSHLNTFEMSLWQSVIKMKPASCGVPNKNLNFQHQYWIDSTPRYNQRPLSALLILSGTPQFPVLHSQFLVLKIANEESALAGMGNELHVINQ